MNDTIIHYEDWQPDSLRGFLAALWVRQRRRGRLPPFEQVSTEGVAVAAVNHGRWIAECGQGDGGALTVSRETLLFMCPVCWNAAEGNRWLPVLFPAPAEKAAVEAVLLARPRLETRNWWAGETVAELLAENAAHGIEGN